MERISTVNERKLFLTLDILLIPVLVILFMGVFSFHFALTVGDWDYWIDWRDRRWWPLVTPLSLIVLPGVFGYLLWDKLRWPLGGTITILGLSSAAWVSRVWNFEIFAGFPLNMVTPSTYVGLGLMLDATLVITKSFMVTGLFGGFLFGFLIYPLNWPIIAPYHLPIEMDGTLMTVADVMGYEYIRTAIPEYVRIIESSTLRTFGEAVVPLTAVFAGFLTVLTYYLWVWVGYLTSKPTWIKKIV
ncbi:MAG: methane monooxygenase/ammonia monooxygenase subunit A [Pseudomonadales bacterium]|nr:methane monooxygenase/ammonia monooxygenase subunit A [Pseudomonadales bacterium]